LTTSTGIDSKKCAERHNYSHREKFLHIYIFSSSKHLWLYGYIPYLPPAGKEKKKIILLIARDP
jgi:hypothetical protein